MMAARAVTVGLFCALLHNAIVILGDLAGLHYAVSLTLSFVIVVVVGYWLHSGWTFRESKRGGSSFARYVLVASANYPASLAGMFLLVDVMALAVPLASPILTVVLFAVNFLGNRWALRGSAKAAAGVISPADLPGARRDRSDRYKPGAPPESGA